MYICCVAAKNWNWLEGISLLSEVLKWCFLLGLFSTLDSKEKKYLACTLQRKMSLHYLKTSVYLKHCTAILFTKKETCWLISVTLFSYLHFLFLEACCHIHGSADCLFIIHQSPFAKCHHFLSEVQILELSVSFLGRPDFGFEYSF